MKFMGILAAAMLVVAPAIASADPASSTEKYSRPAPGPVASSSHEDDDDFDGAPFLLFGGVGILGVGLLVLLNDDGSDGTPSTPDS